MFVTRDVSQSLTSPYAAIAPRVLVIHWYTAYWIFVSVIVWRNESLGVGLSVGRRKGLEVDFLDGREEGLIGLFDEETSSCLFG